MIWRGEIARDTKLPTSPDAFSLSFFLSGPTSFGRFSYFLLESSVGFFVELAAALSPT